MHENRCRLLLHNPSGGIYESQPIGSGTTKAVLVITIRIVTAAAVRRQEYGSEGSIIGCIGPLDNRLDDAG